MGNNIVEFLKNSYSDAHSKKNEKGKVIIIPAFDYGISRGRRGEEKGTTIFVEDKGEIPRQLLCDKIGNDLERKIWRWIEP